MANVQDPRVGRTAIRPRMQGQTKSQLQVSKYWPLTCHDGDAIFCLRFSGIICRCLSYTVHSCTVLRMTRTIAFDDREIEERFVRASGPGGQHVNKVSTAVELRFDVRASSLPPDVKERLLALAGQRSTDDGVLIIDSREHRTQARNREAARQRLIALITQAAKKPRRRKKTKPGRAAREKRLESKKARGKVKELRRKP
ncbi:MAG TPA: alternative ribosome rescue aminoacyl-tRNA hydrolase ArfB [Vicinamibacterales bacterium]|nr:alternative ribosome rescue aminoacyl-tRNA hydrolase ArfB [Vicinamibacterales bacterium]